MRWGRGLQKDRSKSIFTPTNSEGGRTELVAMLKGVGLTVLKYF